jgi:hypothetical protein
MLNQLSILGLGVSELMSCDLSFFAKMLDLDLEFETVFSCELESLVVGDFSQLLK